MFKPQRRIKFSFSGIGQALPSLVPAKQRAAKIAPDGQRLSIRAQFHDRLIDDSVARIENGSVFVVHSVTFHSLDNHEAEPRLIFLIPFATCAYRVWILARFHEHFCDRALIDTVSL